MKKLFYLLAILGLVVWGCGKKGNPLEEENPDGNGGDTETPTEVPFNVKLDGKSTFKVGESVKFLLEGEAESIDFFSGQTGHQYEHRNGRVRPSGMSLKFRLHTPEPTSPAFFVLVSTDFDGDYSSFEGVTQQNWIDITDRFEFPPASTYRDIEIDLSDLTVLGKPFYFAIKHVSVLNASNATDTWTVRVPALYSVLEQSSVLIGSIGVTQTTDPFENTMGFTVLRDHTTNLTTVSNSNAAGTTTDRFAIKGHASNPGAQTWVVSKDFDAVEEIMGDRDESTPIKSPGNSSLTNYSHVYTVPGTYKAHFVAIVIDENGERKEKVKEVTFVVEQ